VHHREDAQAIALYDEVHGRAAGGHPQIIGYGRVANAAAP